MNYKVFSPTSKKLIVLMTDNRLTKSNLAIDMGIFPTELTGIIKKPLIKKKSAKKLLKIAYKRADELEKQAQTVRALASDLDKEHGSDGL